MSTKKVLVGMSLAAAIAAGPTTAIAAERASRPEATAMVKKGVAYLKEKGRDAGYKEISTKNGMFRDRDLYLVVYGLDGVVRAHGANQKMVGKNLLGLRDIDGKAFVKERVDLARNNANFWQEYKFTNPVTRKVQPKEMYCERLEDVVVCGGIYK